ncbi:TRAP transporter small permease [Jannaschia pohangensis]|uniref:TRAP transporter small permease protein n=1 Tax=Jannaschia pohangensis TaxID=390807 RepID=A0A1I3R313_9RHOB|nr:TRAP transporter small permease [Jannaschia pohangensis]SFJ40430.1 Tripartite ATP-independent transporter, DctQ component [Jannaschia pohangensis]
MLARMIEALARVMAILGGIVLSALILMSCASIAGRFLNGLMYSDALSGTALSQTLLAWGLGPINGDFELVEAGMAFTVFAFLPITQLTGGHASVDVLTARFGARVNRVLAVLWSLLFAGVLILIAWQLWQGTQAKARYGETTYLIQFPIWWAYAGALAGAVVSAVVGVYVAAVRVAELLTGLPILASDGADH